MLTVVVCRFRPASSRCSFAELAAGMPQDTAPDIGVHIPNKQRNWSLEMEKDGQKIVLPTSWYYMLYLMQQDRSL